MCQGCYLEYGQPSLNSKEINRAAQLIRIIYQESGTGGPLHSILDDWNLENEHIEFHENWLTEREANYSNRLAQSSRELLEIFKKMTVPERASSLAHAEGFIKLRE